MSSLQRDQAREACAVFENAKNGKSNKQLNTNLGFSRMQVYIKSSELLITFLFFYCSMSLLEMVSIFIV